MNMLVIALCHLISAFVRESLERMTNKLAWFCMTGTRNWCTLFQLNRKQEDLLGLIVHHEPVARGDHQQNGAVESTLEQVRARAGILVSQIEKEVAGGRLIFPATHPVYNWALLHSAWLINRYVVKQGTTVYERSSDRVYSGKLCMYGESVLGYIKTDRKAAPRWSRGIWLGKTLVNDTHIIAHPSGVFVTRSVRRLPTPFVLEELGDVHHSPWEFGYASLGHRMLYNRQVSPPQAVGMPMIDVEAIQVQKYADENPDEDRDTHLHQVNLQCQLRRGWMEHVQQKANLSARCCNVGCSETC